MQPLRVNTSKLKKRMMKRTDSNKKKGIKNVVVEVVKKKSEESVTKPKMIKTKIKKSKVKSVDDPGDDEFGTQANRNISDMLMSKESDVDSDSSKRDQTKSMNNLKTDISSVVEKLGRSLHFNRFKVS